MPYRDANQLQKLLASRNVVVFVGACDSKLCIVLGACTDPSKLCP